MDFDNSMIIPTRFESLSTELLLEIVEYLDTYNLILALHGLNRRLDSILRSCRLHVLFDERKKDVNVWKRLISVFNQSQIYILSLNHSDESIHKRFTPPISESLRSISLQNINKTSLQWILEHLPMKNQLKSLYVKNCWYPVTSDDGTIDEFIFTIHGHRLTSLINCSLVLMPYSSSFPSLPTIFPHLRRLSLNDSRWTTNTIVFLLQNTPNLRSLRIHPYGKFSQASSTMKIHLNHIRSLEIILTNNTTELPSLLILFSGLQRLRIVYYDIELCPVLDGSAWQKLIGDHLPDLQRLTLDFCDEDDKEIDEHFVNTFRRGEFWSKRQILTELTMDEAVSDNPVGKRIYLGAPWTFDTSMQS